MELFGRGPDAPSLFSRGELLQSVDRFTREVLVDLSRTEIGNAMISPWGVYDLMSLLRSSAGREAGLALGKVLCTSAMPHDVHSQLRVARADMLGTIDSGALASATAILTDTDVELKEEFRHVAAESFDADIRQVRFPEPACQEINEFARMKTDGRIPKIVDSLRNDARIVAANAISFVDKWQKPFPSDHSGPRPFHLASGDRVDVPMMELESTFEYGEDKLSQHLRLEYRCGLSMSLILPRPGISVSDALVSLQTLSSRAHHSYRGVVTLPRWKSEFEWNVLDWVMRKIDPAGPKLVFTEMASEPLSLSAFNQRTFIEVDEEGTDARAIGMFLMTASAKPKIVEPFEFRADRPFIYFIRSLSGIPLFAGIVKDPVG
ncbi:MAG: serpin family protein [Armatimonadetes bacterium]|nr:serpin family protein [Armatimonadota bacterium]